MHESRPVTEESGGAGPVEVEPRQVQPAGSGSLVGRLFRALTTGAAGLTHLWKSIVQRLRPSQFGFRAGTTADVAVKADVGAMRLGQVATEYFADIPGEFDIAPLAIALKTEKDVSNLEDVLRVLGKNGCPLEVPLIQSIAAPIAAKSDIAALEMVIRAVRPNSSEAWLEFAELIEVIRERRHGLIILAKVAQGLAAFQYGLGCELLERLIAKFESLEQAESFVEAIKTLPQLSLEDDLLAGIAGQVGDVEFLGALAEMIHILSSRQRTEFPPGSLLALLVALPNRLAMKRFHRALDLVDGTSLELDVFDPLLPMLAGSSQGMEWLETTLAQVDSLDGHDLRFLSLLHRRAPYPVTVARYLRGMKAMGPTQLPLEDVDALLIPYLESESTIQTFVMTSQICFELFGGRLTKDQVQRLLSSFSGPVAIKRFRRSLELLNDAGLPPTEVRDLALQIAPTEENLAWLEGLMNHSQADGQKLTSVEILGYWNRCPDVARLYRYLKLLRLLGQIGHLDSSVRQEVALDASESQLAAKKLTQLLSAAIQSGETRAYSANDLMMKLLAVKTTLDPL